MLCPRSPASPDPNNAFQKNLLLAYLPSENGMNLNLCSTKVPLQLPSVISAFKEVTLGLIRTQLQPRAQQSPGAGFGQQSPQQLRLLQRCHRDVTGPHKPQPQHSVTPGTESLSCHIAVTPLVPPSPADRTGLWEINHWVQLQKCCFSLIHSLSGMLQETFSQRSRAADHCLATDKCQKRPAKSFLYKCSISLPKFLRYSAIQTSASFHLQASVPKMVLPSSSAVQLQPSFILLLVPVVLWNRDCFAFDERGIYL